MFDGMMKRREHLTRDENAFFVGSVDSDFVGDDIFRIGHDFSYDTFVTKSIQKSRGGNGVFTLSFSILYFQIIATPNPVDFSNRKEKRI